MLTAYLDESGHETKNWVIIAGFLGNDGQWKQCAEKWRKVLGARKELHMKKLWWQKPGTKAFLAKLGPIPHECGLTALVAAVRVSDYQDLVEGTLAEKLTKGYVFCLMTIIDSLIKNIPANEQVKIVLEQQNEYQVQAIQIFNSDANLKHKTLNGLPKLSGIEFISKNSSDLTQPADYLAYALLQRARDAESKKAKWSEPILENTQPAFGIVHADSREQLRTIIKNTLQSHPEFAAKKHLKPSRP